MTLCLSAKSLRELSLLAGVAVGTLFATGAGAQDALEKVKASGVIKIANSGVYPPFEFKEGDKLVGFDVDLAELVAKELGVKADISVIDFKGLIPSLKSGKVDLLVTAMTHTPARAEQVAFSESYYDTAVAIAVRDDKTAIASKSALDGKVIGAELGTTGEREARSIKSAKEIKTYDTLMLALRDLEIGRSDAVVSNLPPLQYLIHKNFPRVKVTATYDSGWVGINTRLEDKTLMAEINRILKQAKANGELERIRAKWFGKSK